MITAAQLPALQIKLGEWSTDPLRFVRQAFLVVPDPWQADVLESYRTRQRVAMKACVGCGKTAVLAWIVWHFLATRSFPKVVAMSITWPNLRDNLWAELEKWRHRNPFLTRMFAWTERRVFAVHYPERWWCSARSWERSASPEQQGQTLAGLHERNSMVIADETGGYPESVLENAEGVLADSPDAARLVQAGNPTHLAGPLYAACTRDRDLWAVHEITGDPDAVDRAPRVSREWARAMIAKRGRNNSWVRAKVLGRFPSQASDAVLGLHHFEDAYGRTATADGQPIARHPQALGVDVARFGDNETVVAHCEGLFVHELVTWSGKDTEETADRVDAMARERGFGRRDSVRIDDVGVGGGVTDKLRKLHNRAYEVHGINVGSRATKLGPDRKPIYANLKAQVNLQVAELFRGCLVGLAESIRDSALASEATDIRYRFARGGGVYQVEPKTDYAARHQGSSPDHWDAVVLGLCELPRAQIRGLVA